MRGSKPFLLSTTATLEKFGILDYEGFDFTWDHRSHRTYTKDRIRYIVGEVLHRCIIPNAIVAKQAGHQIPPNEPGIALKYAMTHNKPQRMVDEWRQFVEENKEWMECAVTHPIKFYVYDTLFDKETNLYRKEKVSRKRRYTVDKYVKRAFRKKRDRIKLKVYANVSSPALNGLINAYSADRKVGDMTCRAIAERFKVAVNTANKFKKWLKQRELSGKHPSFLVRTRKTHERKRDTVRDTAGSDREDRERYSLQG